MNIFGAKELDALLKELAERGGQRYTRQAVAKAMRVIAKRQKQAVPPQYKHVKKLIGSRFGKAPAGRARGTVQAKAGFAVGKKKTRIDKATGVKSASKLMASRKNRTRKNRKAQGVGISLNNIHWLVLGTKQRAQKKTGRRTGAMPAVLKDLIPAATAAATYEAKTAMIDSLIASLAKVKAT